MSSFRSLIAKAFLIQVVKHTIYLHRIYFVEGIKIAVITITTEKKFFIPKAKDADQAEEVWESVKKFAEKNLGWDISDRRIFSITYHKHGENYYVEIGKPDPRNGELVIAILDSVTYLVCTPNRGVLRGIPILVDGSELTEVTDFPRE